MIVSVTATVQYVCYLTEEDAEKVRAKADEFGGDMITAVCVLYSAGEIDLYHESTESDFSTESIDQVDEGE